MQAVSERRSISKSKKLSILLIMILFIPISTNFIGSILYTLGLDTLYSTIGIYAIIFIYSIYVFLYPRLLINPRKITLYALSLSILVISFLIFKDTRVYYQLNIIHLATIFLIYIPMALSINKINNWIPFFRYIKFLAYLTPLLVIIGISFFNLDNFINYMVLSNAVLPGMLGLYAVLRLFKSGFFAMMFKLALFTIYFYLIIIYGSRMSFFSVIIFIIIIEMIFFNFSSIKKKSTSFVYYSIIILLIFLSITTISDNFFSLIRNSQLSSNSYILQNLLNNEIFSSDSRMVIYENSFREIKNMGLNLYGLFGDRVVMEKYDLLGGPAIYVHNIFLELLLQFGIIIGSFISFILVIIVCKSLLKPLNRTDGLISAFFFSLIFLRLLVSGSYIIEGQFVLYLAVIVNSYIGEKKSDNYE